MLLLIPGPVQTRPELRQAAARDIAPWDNETRAMVRHVCRRILDLAGGITDQHAALPLQGSGHFLIEAAIRTFMPPGARILVPGTGEYATRIVRLAREAGRIPVALPVPQDRPVPPRAVAEALAADPTIGHVGLVVSETATGVLHDGAAVGQAVRAAGRRLILDVVSSFGAVPLDVAAQPELDAAVFTANKCLESLPGIGFAVAPVPRLLECAGNAGSWTLDLAEVYAHGLRSPGAFRFTPAIQAIAALDVALDLLAAEGGPSVRLARYRDNVRVLRAGLRALGLEPCIADDAQGPVVVNVHAPRHPAWDLQLFVDALKRRGVLISNFFSTVEPSFRVGCIGAVGPDDMARAVAAIGAALTEMGIGQRRAA